MSRDAKGPKESFPLCSIGWEVLQITSWPQKFQHFSDRATSQPILCVCVATSLHPWVTWIKTNGAPPLISLDFSYDIYVRGHRPGWEWECVAKSYTESLSIDQLGSSSLHQQVLQFSSEMHSASTNRRQPSADSWFVTILKDTKNRTEVAIFPNFLVAHRYSNIINPLIWLLATK